ncbi:MAG: phenyllactyl-CoA dehydratase activase FldI [bacterium]
MGSNWEYWRWSETKFVDESLDWRKADVVTCGIDLGSVSTKVVVCLDGELYAYSILRTGVSGPDSASKAFAIIESITGLTIKECHYVVATGYGRVNVPFANRSVTEISCHGMGAHFLGGNRVRTILDMGGQDCKAIHIDEYGKVTNFLMNDKCAAGTGRGMEVLADLLEVPIEEIGPRSFDIDEEPEAVSNVCVVYARTEAIGLLKKGWSKNKVLAAYCRAMAERVAGLIKRIGVEPEFFVTGGISKNIGVVKRIERIIGLEALKSSVDTQIAGALGAALFARKLYEKVSK